MQKSRDEYAVAVIFAMGLELGAFRPMLEREHRTPKRQRGDPNSYVAGEINGHNIILAFLPGTQGTVAAARVSSNLSRTFKHIRLQLLVGVGGRVAGEDEATLQRRDMRLGDVVVAMPANGHHGLVQYDLGRDLDGGFQLKGFLAPSPEFVRSAIIGLQTDREMLTRISEHIRAVLDGDDEDGREYGRPPASTDVLLLPNVPHVSHGCDCRNLMSRYAVRRAPRAKPDIPKIHYGLIASGNSVIMSNGSRRRILNQLNNYGDVLCFEMEGAGLATESSCLVIRGISDYADPHKQKGWQCYAALAAAAFAKELLLTIQPDEGEANSSDTDNSESRDECATLTRGVYRPRQKVRERLFATKYRV
ncbi:nucleoside phosphorylase domain-containing protein [Emericellopsis atlantica]|uniref:Nucleoside phosphorylase domain-containing protein n=1 Tax=Emericellopsis atlantica TaxID=2614577 RepID=A0A9P7ZTZ0_9HYPO|nr:nucleoside phosphorylase domain-containing protein [Emericellopsis atlantica]KAG9258056.1 nucleoside phosphorylase domain-containing protein [Emericellopsis atlantica]